MTYKGFSVPAYYRDKEGHERAKNILQEIGQKCLSMALADNGDSSYLEANKIFNLDFCPKFLDDTHLVVVSRCHPIITAAQILRQKNISQPYFFSGLISWLHETYIPYCDKLIYGFRHSFSNHGALGLMGKVIALSFLYRYYKDVSDFPNLFRVTRKLNWCLKSWKLRVLFSILKNNFWKWNKHEVWIENLRNSKGMYYTGLHLGALLRCYVSFRNVSLECSFKAIARLFFAGKKFQDYCKNPDSWPYKQPTKIWGLKWLQNLLLPSGGEMVLPRKDGKEGNVIEAFRIFADFINVFDWVSDIESFDHEGPFPKLTEINKNGLNKTY